MREKDRGKKRSLEDKVRKSTASPTLSSKLSLLVPDCIVSFPFLLLFLPLFLLLHTCPPAHRPELSLSFCFLCVLKPYVSHHLPSCFLFILPTPCHPRLFFLYHLSPVVAVCLSTSGPPVPCTCHCAQPFDKSHEGQTEFCRTRQSLNIWPPCPLVLGCML